MKSRYADFKAPTTERGSIGCRQKLQSSKRKHTWLMIMLAIIALGMVASLSGCGKTDSSESAESATSSSSEPEAVEIDVELKATTEYLEYSNKDVDPTTLVKASDSDAKVSTKDKIDLGSVGAQSVTYTIAVGDQTKEQKIEFMVRDTKAPIIKLSDDSPSIEQGASYDPQTAIASIADEVDGELSRLDAAPQAKGKSAGTEIFYDKGWYIMEGSIDSSTPGTHVIKITAADKHGNLTTKELGVTVKEPVQEATPAAAAPSAQTQTYILNTRTHVFHLPGCRKAKEIKDSNKQEIVATRDEVDVDYDPCGICNP